MNKSDSATATDPYAVLGVTKTVTADEIKKAHRNLERSSHPDLHPDDPGAEVRFKAISNAYDLLKDPQTRARFDAGEIDAQGAERPPRQYYRDFAGSPDERYQQRRGFGSGSGPADIFAEILRQQGKGGRSDFDRDFASDFDGHSPGGGNHAATGGGVRYTLEVPFLDPARGAETRIILRDGQSLAEKIP